MSLRFYSRQTCATVEKYEGGDRGVNGKEKKNIRGLTCLCSFRTRSTTLPAQPAILEAMSTERCRAASLTTLAPGPCARRRRQAHGARRSSRGLTKKGNGSTRETTRLAVQHHSARNCKYHLCVHVSNQTVLTFLDRGVWNWARDPSVTLLIETAESEVIRDSRGIVAGIGASAVPAPK